MDDKNSTVDLSLLPIETLIKELMDRTDTCIVGYTRQVDAGAPSIYINHSCPSGWLQGVGLCNVIQTELVRRNWHVEEEG